MSTMEGRITQAEAYHEAQRALADLKSAICRLLCSAEGDIGLTNSEIGRLLGIYHGHVGHEGHIPRTLLAIMEAEGLVKQNPTTKRWRLRRFGEGDDDSGAESNPSAPK